jgi:hypothetical protein
VTTLPVPATNTALPFPAATGRLLQLLTVAPWLPAVAITPSFDMVHALAREPVKIPARKAGKARVRRDEPDGSPDGRQLIVGLLMPLPQRDADEEKVRRREMEMPS